MSAFALMSYPRYVRVHRALHRLWSKSGTTHYVKDEWMELEAAIGELAREGIGEPESVLPTSGPEKAHRTDHSEGK